MDPFLVHRGKLSNLAAHQTLIISHTRLVKEVQLREGRRENEREKGKVSKLPASCSVTRPFDLKTPSTPFLPFSVVLYAEE